MNLVKTKLLLLYFIICPFVNIISQENYFEYANNKIKEYKPKKKEYVIVIDYKKNILAERLFVLDMKKNKIILSSKVAHAYDSGLLYSKKYSNKVNSKMSSCGNFITIGTYYGKFGYSMKVKGLDPGINNNAEKRLIVFHSDKKMKTKWSDGCFATPEEINKKIIDLTRNGILVCVIS